MILETSFILDCIKGEDKAVSKMAVLLHTEEHIGIAALTIFELWTGLSNVREKLHEKDKIDTLIKDQVIYSLDKKSAQIAGKINGDLIKKGLQIDPEDCMIAGIAISNNQKVLTNDKHFNRVEGLKVETY